MLIHFGLHRDGLDPTPPKTALGEATLGAQGLIRVLETDLGLAPVREHPAEQLMAYRGCLAEANDLMRFYHRSFAIDPINVSRTLLDWRAQWYAAGWDGTFPESAAARLRDLAAVEALARDRVPATPGQRVQRIARDLGPRRTQIERVVLHDDPAELPAAWRGLLERLDWCVAPGVNPAPQGRSGSDLHTVQTVLEALANRPEGQPSTPTRLRGDGSFLVLRGVSRDLSARAVAEAVGRVADPRATAVIAERDGIILDNAFERSALPRCGFQHYSRFRAVSQVLKLCLALLWEPVNPHLLLQFLIHPLGPVPGRARRALASAVATEPGIGGRAWRDALDTLADASPEDAKRLRADVAYWFEAPRFRVTGAPVERVTERAQRCARWLQQRLATADASGAQAMFRAAYAQAEALMTTLAGLRQQGQASIAKRELDRLLDEVTRQQPDPETFAESGRVRAAIHPAAITEPFAQVVWWDLSAANANQVLQYPWSWAELADLRAAGVALPPVEQRLAWQGAGWRRPLLNARERFIVVVHDSDEGHHPLWSQLTGALTGFSEIRIDDALFQGAQKSILHLDVGTEEIPVRPLAAPRRWWRLPGGEALAARDVESYSSLSKLFFHPHEWVLTYPAGIKKGKLEDLADGPLLYGNLAHRLFEVFFEDHPQWRILDAAAVSAWLAANLPRLVLREAALLLEPGRGVDRANVTATLERALGRLLAQLRTADIQTVRAEAAEAQPYFGGSLRGTIDLLLTDASDREIVVDAKWGGERFRSEELEANQHLQLASYAYLRKRATGAKRWPYAAYFIVTTGNLLAPDDRIFPDAVVRPPRTDEGLEALWARAETRYRWRRAQLDHGEIEVNVAGTEPTDRSNAPESSLPDRGPDPYDDFGRLTGWAPFE